MPVCKLYLVPGPRKTAFLQTLLKRPTHPEPFARLFGRHLEFFSQIRRFRKKPEVAWKRGLRALRSSRHLAVNINWINNRSRKCFKMEQVNIEDIKLTPKDIPGASFKDSEICKLTVNQLKFWFKCRRVNQGGNKKVLYERYMLNFKVKFILT